MQMTLHDEKSRAFDDETQFGGGVERAGSGPFACRVMSTATCATSQSTATRTTARFEVRYFSHRGQDLSWWTCAEYPTMSSSSRDFHRKRKSWARRIERCCCGALAYFPLLFVYGLLSWAAWVQISIGFWPNEGKWTGKYWSLVLDSRIC
jgi:hypothetical protein